MPVDVPDNGDNAVNSANEIIESAVANVQIEIEMAKAARVGTMLRVWRGVMVNDTSPGVGFPPEWVDQAAWRIFEVFYPAQQLEAHGDDDEIE